MIYANLVPCQRLYKLQITLNCTNYKFQKLIYKLQIQSFLNKLGALTKIKKYFLSIFMS